MKFALSDLIEKRAHLALITCNLKFHAAVRQIAHPTSHVKAFGDVAHSETEANTLDVTFIEHLERDHHLLQVRTRHRLFVRIADTETAFLILGRINRYNILAAVLRREACGRLVPFAEILRAHLLAAFVIHADSNFFQWLRRAHRKPILISGIKIHRNQGVLVWLKHPARMSVSNLEAIISKCSGELESVFTRAHLSVRVSPENNGGAQRKNNREKLEATSHLG